MKHWLSRIKTFLRTVTKKFHEKKKKKHGSEQFTNSLKKNIYIYIYPSEENFEMELLSITYGSFLNFNVNV